MLLTSLWRPYSKFSYKVAKFKRTATIVLGRGVGTHMHAVSLDDSDDDSEDEIESRLSAVNFKSTE